MTRPNTLSRLAAVGCSVGVLAVTVLAGPSSTEAFATPGVTPPPAARPASASSHYEARVASGLATVSVTADSKGTWTVAWAGSGIRSVQILVGPDAHHLAKATTARGTSGSATVKSAAARPWVLVVPDRGTPVLTASRVLGLASASNARDVGGYRTTTGRWVKTGVVYRTNQLSLSAADTAFVNTLRITADYDLRTTSEVTAHPDVVPTGARYLNLNVLGDASATLPSITTPAQAAQYMRDVEVTMVDSASAKAAYKTLLTGLATDRGASLYHCTAGKDRTGWATAVLLTLLGVDSQTVMDDYLLSNTYYLDTPAIQAQLAAMGAAGAVYEPFMAVDATYLQAGLDRVQQEYGSMERYAIHGLGLSHRTIEQLRQRLLVQEPDHRR